MIRITYVRLAGRYRIDEVAGDGAVRAEDVLCADETPTNVIGKDTDEQGEPVPLSLIHISEPTRPY